MYSLADEGTKCHFLGTSPCRNLPICSPWHSEVSPQCPHRRRALGPPSHSWGEKGGCTEDLSRGFICNCIRVYINIVSAAIWCYVYTCHRHAHITYACLHMCTHAALLYIIINTLSRTICNHVHQS